MAETLAASGYVLRADRVADGLHELRHAGIHRHTVGYLCVVQEAAQSGRDHELQPDFKVFHERYLAVPDGPSGFPYFNPFELSGVKVWMNPNVAGSYSQSSVRSGSPFRRVVEIEGARNEQLYTLLADHPRLARENLAGGNRIPALPLAAVLYRNYRMDEPDLDRLVRRFQYDFGYLTVAGDTADPFDTLFAYSAPDSPPDDWFQPYDG